MKKQKPVILVVDDDATVVEMITDGLTTENFEVISSLTPEAGLKKVKHDYIDFALLDLDLGWNHMTGIELGRELQKIFPDLVVIIMTGYHNLKFAVQAMREHSFHYMIKPFRIDQIVSLTERAQRELALKSENEALKNRVDSLEEEINALKALVKQIRPEEASLTRSSRDRAVKRSIRSSDALNSYNRQKNDGLHIPPKKE